MPSFFSVTTEIVGAGATLAGLILVFLGATLTGFDAYDTATKKLVRVQYRSRARSTFYCFCLSLSSAVIGLIAKLFRDEVWSAVALATLVVAVAWIAWVAKKTVWEIS